MTPGHGFKPWKKPLAEMRGKVVYNRPLWSGRSPDPLHSGSFSSLGFPLFKKKSKELEQVEKRVLERTGRLNVLPISSCRKFILVLITN